ncbi:MAG: 6-hydroxycyclohex-1-ene-1-carbonyl-CoA dehydrogenase [Planctomycetota bacterium]|nr:MAG: 6-hydroxycyclohex-1-ene-1-carbonyl-CoA dehydrogenase [Planctomycetota bacterium]
MRARGYALTELQAPLEALDFDLAPGSGEALVEVCGCGVCHTDISFIEGVPTRRERPLVLGHEVSGRVVALGEGADPALEGRAVIVPAVLPCGECALCAKGRGEICRRQVFPGSDTHGGFASHLVVPARFLQPVDVPWGKPLARLSVIADAVSTAFQSVERSGLAEGDFAIFVGAGGVGGFGIQIARALGARTLAIDIDPERLAALREHGAEWTLNPTGRSAKEIKREVRALAKESDLPATEWKIFETSGTAPGQELAFALLGFGATLSVVGYHAGEVSVRLSNLMAFDARALGNWGCDPARYPRAIDTVLSGLVALDPFIEFFPMSRVNEVIDRMRRGEQRKRPILLPDFDRS